MPCVQQMSLHWKSLVDVAVKTLQTGQRIPVVF